MRFFRSFLEQFSRYVKLPIRTYLFLRWNDEKHVLHSEVTAVESIVCGNHPAVSVKLSLKVIEQQ
jgi:hypothetical protein